MVTPPLAQLMCGLLPTRHFCRTAPSLPKGGLRHAGEHSVLPTACSSNGASPVWQHQGLRHAGGHSVNPTVCSSNGACPVWHHQLQLSKGGLRHAGEQSVQPTVCTSNGACPVWHRSPRSQSTPQPADNHRSNGPSDCRAARTDPQVRNTTLYFFVHGDTSVRAFGSRCLTSPADRGRRTQSILQLPCHEGCFFRHRFRCLA
jgi:hypothetical protein